MSLRACALMVEVICHTVSYDSTSHIRATSTEQADRHPSQIAPQQCLLLSPKPARSLAIPVNIERA